MKHSPTATNRSPFEVLASTDAAQAAMMTLQPGQSSDDEIRNEHPRSEQWLYVISGEGYAESCDANGPHRHSLKPGALLLIERGESHRVTNDNSEPLVTLNFYAPPAYGEDGSVLKPAH